MNLIYAVPLLLAVLALIARMAERYSIALVLALISIALAVASLASSLT